MIVRCPQRSGTNRFKVFAAPLDFADPIAAYLSTAPSFARPFVLGARRRDIIQLSFLVTLGMYLQVSAETFLLREGLALA